MPIPLVLPPEESQSQPLKPLQLVESAPHWHGAPLVPRSIAFFLDVLVVYGFSLYVSKLVSLLLVSAYMTEIEGTGRMASRLFHDTFVHGQAQLGLGSFVFFSFAYFVMLPHFSGRTLGLGLLGLKIVGASGEKPSLFSLLIRQLGCLAQFATGGMMLLQALKGPSRPLFQDSISRTAVVRVSGR